MNNLDSYLKELGKQQQNKPKDPLEANENSVKTRAWPRGV